MKLIIARIKAWWFAYIKNWDKGWQSESLHRGFHGPCTMVRVFRSLDQKTIKIFYLREGIEVPESMREIK